VFSKIIRRTHMYLALFLTPWILMYALSTMAMNHREWLRGGSGETLPQFEKEREEPYQASFAPDARPQAIGEKILEDARLVGAFNARKDSSGAVVIVRQDPVTPRRITYSPAESKLVIEKEVFRWPAFLERMHRRRGYQHAALDDSWAFSVDLVIAAMIFWVLSGLWMWWELRATWRLGALFAAGGLALFALFLFTI
jgi:hypothetical protein